MKSFGHFIRVVYFLLILYMIHKQDKRKKAIDVNIWTFIITGLFIIILLPHFPNVNDIDDIFLSFCGNFIVGLFDASLFITYILIAILIYSYIRWLTQKKEKTDPNSTNYDREFPAKFSQYLKQHFF